MICTLVDELVRISSSSQTTTVPSTVTLVAGLINSLDIGRLFGGETLEKVNEMLLTVTVCTGKDCSTELIKDQEIKHASMKLCHVEPLDKCWEQIQHIIFPHKNTSMYIKQRGYSLFIHE